MGDPPANTEAKFETQMSESATRLTSRELNLLDKYTDPASPGYQNATRSAELAGYKGLAGSNQLSVQGSRTLRRARDSGVLRRILIQNGCTVERAAERLSACLDAKRKRVFFKDGEIVEGPLEDNYQEQRLAAKLVFQLHNAFDSTRGEEPSPAAAPQGPAEQANEQQVSREFRNALATLNECDAIDRDSLRDVLECDAKSGEFEACELQSEPAEQSLQKRISEDDSNKA